MKKTLIVIGALGAVLALILTSMVLGIGSEGATEEHLEGNGPEDNADLNFFEAWPSSLDVDEKEEPTASYNFFEAWPSNDEGWSGEEDCYVDTDDASTEPAVPRFSELVKRSYNFLTRDFISQYSHWEKLPAVKTIFTTNSSGEWMYKALPRINATGEARIIDRDGDGYPELVIWKHYRRNLTASTDQVNITKGLIREHAEKMDLSRISVYMDRGFTLVYVDRDGDANPERISLDVSNKLWVNIDNDNLPEFLHSFRWFGITRDVDDDGKQDIQRMRISIKTLLNLRNDRIPELVMYEKIHYSRMDLQGRPMWDMISARVNKGMTFDPNSDGNPSVKERMGLHGYWLNKDGDMWPQLIRISKRSSDYHDKDSDGIPEERNITSVSLHFMDRNDDTYPELVVITYRNMKYFDRDSDGRVDVIKVHIKIFKWIDRNSDGIPERVTRSETYETIYPQNDRPKNGIEPEKERPEQEKPEERPKDDLEDRASENERTPEQRPEEKKEEEREPRMDNGEPETERENNRQLSSRA